MHVKILKNVYATHHNHFQAMNQSLLSSIGSQNVSSSNEIK